MLTNEIREFLVKHDALWADLDVEGLSALWDSETSPIYLGEEYPTPIVGWPALGRHWSRIGSRLRHAEVRTELLDARSPADGVAVVLLRCDWTFVGVEDPQLHSGTNWVTAVLVAGPGGWRLIHYAESPAYPAAAG